MKKVRDKDRLAVALRLEDRPVILVGEGDRANEMERRIKRAGGRIVAEGSKAAIAIVFDDPAAVSRLKVRGILVLAIDQPEASDFTFVADAESTPAPPPSSGSAASVPPPSLSLSSPPRNTTSPATQHGGTDAAVDARPHQAPNDAALSSTPAVPPVSQMASQHARRMLGAATRGLGTLGAGGATFLRQLTRSTRRERVALDLALAKGGPLDPSIPLQAATDAAAGPDFTAARP